MNSNLFGLGLAIKEANAESPGLFSVLGDNAHVLIPGGIAAAYGAAKEETDEDGNPIDRSLADRALTGLGYGAGGALLGVGGKALWDYLTPEAAKDLGPVYRKDVGGSAGGSLGRATDKVLGPSSFHDSAVENGSFKDYVPAAPADYVSRPTKSSSLLNDYTVNDLMPSAKVNLNDSAMHGLHAATSAPGLGLGLASAGLGAYLTDEEEDEYGRKSRPTGKMIGNALASGLGGSILYGGYKGLQDYKAQEGLASLRKDIGDTGFLDRFSKGYSDKLKQEVDQQVDLTGTRQSVLESNPLFGLRRMTDIEAKENPDANLVANALEARAASPEGAAAAKPEAKTETKAKPEAKPDPKAKPDEKAKDK